MAPGAEPGRIVIVDDDAAHTQARCDTLEGQGLVRRVAHPEDRRMLLIELTDKAGRLLKEVWREHFPAETEMISALSKQEKETLVRLLGKLQTHLEERAEQADGVSAKKAG